MTRLPLLFSELRYLLKQSDLFNCIHGLDSVAFFKRLQVDFLVVFLGILLLELLLAVGEELLD